MGWRQGGAAKGPQIQVLLNKLLKFKMCHLTTITNVEDIINFFPFAVEICILILFPHHVPHKLWIGCIEVEHCLQKTYTHDIIFPSNQYLCCKQILKKNLLINFGMNSVAHDNGLSVFGNTIFSRISQVVLIFIAYSIRKMTDHYMTL